MSRRKKNHLGVNWKDYFSFNNRVRRGLIVLFGLMGIEIVVMICLRFIPASSGAIDIQKFKNEIDAYYDSGITSGGDQLENTDSSGTSTKEYPGFAYHSGKVNPGAELFHFNPNGLPAEEWKRLGFSERQVRSILNYEAKGGKFRTRKDVKKMYAISAPEFSRIEPYIDLPESLEKKSGTTLTRKYQPLQIDIGTADQVELEKLPMVGEYLAGKISNYREKLGGFYSISQVKEVWGMRDSVFMVIVPHLVLKDSTNLRKINLNTADRVELNRHPYIDHALASMIINYRGQHGDFREIEDLRRVALVDVELYRKIAPYLKVK